MDGMQLMVVNNSINIHTMKTEELDNILQLLMQYILVEVTLQANLINNL